MWWDLFIEQSLTLLYKGELVSLMCPMAGLQFDCIGFYQTRKCNVVKLWRIQTSQTGGQSCTDNSHYGLLHKGRLTIN